MKSASLRLWWLFLVAVVAGCGAETGQAGGPQIVANADAVADQATGEDAQPGDDATPDVATPDVAGVDVAGPDDAVADAALGDVAQDAGQDAAVQPDATSPDAAVDAGGDATGCTQGGCPCAADAECGSGVCADSATGKACAATCTDTCAPGLACVAGAAGKYCAPAFARLCEPCQKDSDCLELAGITGTCVTYQDGGSVVGQFCGGGACSDKVQCPGGYTCKDVVSVGGQSSAQCVRTDLACPCDSRAIALSLTTPCSNVNDLGVCTGKRGCSASGLSACSAATPSPETCDGSDNNCDGVTDDVSCDDKNGCTADACDAAQKGCTHTPVSAPCDDGTKCTANDACQNGACTGKPKNCDDQNECTDDSCDPATGCVFANATGLCGAGDACTVPGTCQSGLCAGVKPKSCDDFNACTIDVCDPTVGCTHKTSTAGCNDNDPCTTGDSCATGVCMGTAKNCDDGNPCTDDTCDATGCHNTATGGPCDDGNACTSGDICSAGVCSGKGKSCNDGNSCTNDTCDLTNGCAHVLVAGAGCDDGNPCSAGDKCDGTGTCLSGNAVQCDDGNACTSDACDGVTGVCKYTNLAGSCDDGVACTVSDVCLNGQCAGTAKKCTDGNTCTVDQCDNVKGCVFVSVTGATCDDGNACTAGDKCDATGGCKPGTAINCDDQNACTADVCDLTTGVCKNTPISSACEDGSACTKQDFCVGTACVGTAISCDDQNACTTDSCDIVKGCVHGNVTGTCNDGNPCTLGEACAAGACSGGTAAPCDDANTCTTDACDPKSGCTHTGNNLACTDGNACTTGDTCDPVTQKCVSGTNQCSCQTQTDCDAQPNANLCLGKLKCDTSALPYKCIPDTATKVICDTSKDTACSVTTCDNASGTCKAGAVNSGGPCTDGSACTVGDTCTGGTCVSGNAPNCDDNNVCTTDSCDPATGCKNVNNTIGCVDGDACTQNDTCSGGKCGGVAVVGCCLDSSQCNDNNPCTVDVCDAVGGTCKHDAVAANGQACNADSSGCTQNDLCVAGVCTAGAAPDCSGQADQCNTGACSSSGTNTFACVKVAKTNGITCDDGVFCNTGEACQGGVCKGGTTKDCSSSGCTTGACDEVQKKCVGSPKADGTACDADGNGCTINDTCASGVCVPGSNFQCTQPVGDPCNTWGCVSTGSASYQCKATAKSLGTTCDDGVYCTVNEVCDGAGACKNGTARDCSGLGTQCTSGVCDEVNKTCKSSNKTDNTACNDGDGCTATDSCKSGVCVGANNACGDFKLSTFKTAATASNPGSSLVDMGSGRIRAAFANSTTAVAGRSYRSDWAREWMEAAMATASAVTGNQETLVGSPTLVPSAAGGHDLYWVSDYSGNQTVWYYGPGGLNACSGPVYNSSGYSNAVYSAYAYCSPYGGSSCISANRAYGARHISFQHFDTLDVASGGVVDVLSVNTGCTTAQQVPITAWAIAPYADGKRLLAWIQSGVVNRRIINANGTLYKDLGTDSTAQHFDVAVNPGDGTSIYVSDDGAEVWGQLYYSNGTTNGSKFQLNTNATGVQSFPHVTYEASTGIFVAAWNTDVQSGDIQAQVFFSDGSKAGSEFTANTTTTGAQTNARIGTHADNNFVIVYEDAGGKDGAGYGILAQWFDSSGNKVGNEKVVNATITAGDQRYPAVTSLATGEVVISWTNMADGNVYGRKFNSSGVAQNGATEFLVNTTKTDEQQNPAVAAAADGSYVVAWDSNLQDGSQQGIYFQRYSASGVVVGTETVANTTTSLAQITPAIGADSAGNFVIVWDSYGQDGSMNGIFGQRFTSAGAKAGSEFQLNQFTTNDQRRPSVASQLSGKFAAVWESNGQTGGAAYDVIMRCYDSNGTALGNEFILNTTTADKQQYANIVAFPDGTQKYLVTWQSYAEDGDGWGIYAQLMTFDCKAVGSPWKVNTTTTSDQTWPKAAVDSTGKFVIAWSSLSQDGDNYGIYAQAYDNTGAKIGNETRLNQVTAYEQSHPAVAMYANSKFVATWQTVGEDESGASTGWALKGAAFTIGASAITQPALDWLVNTTYVNDQNQPAVAARADGTIVNVWRSALQDGYVGGVVGRIQTP